VSYKSACEELLTVWAYAKIPTQRIDSCVRKLSKLYERYLALKVHRTRELERDRNNEAKFKTDLKQLFDIAPKDVMTHLKNEEDREFLLKQREDIFSCSISGIDQIAFEKESRKRQLEERKMATKARYEEWEKTAMIGATAELSSTASSQESQSEDEYRPSKTAPDVAPSKPKQSKNIFMSPEVVGALDRVNLPDRGAVFVAGAIAEALGHNLSDITLSRSSVRRSRRVGRQKAAATEDQECSLQEPLLLHWDGKLLPDIDGSKTIVDRIAVLVTGNSQEKLLGIPKNGQRYRRGSGKGLC
jgi:hypothetical protein